MSQKCCKCESFKSLKLVCDYHGCYGMQESKPSRNGNGICEDCFYKAFKKTIGYLRSSGGMIENSQYINFTHIAAENSRRNGANLVGKSWSQVMSAMKSMGGFREEDYDQTKVILTIVQIMEMDQIIRNNSQSQLDAKIEPILMKMDPHNINENRKYSLIIYSTYRRQLALWDTEPLFHFCPVSFITSGWQT